MDGVINLFKPPGMTSFDAVSSLRRIYGQKKIGHAGTLDPLAAGVLPIFLGRAARLIEYVPAHPKIYSAEFIMGISTDTEDVCGHVISTDQAVSDWGIWREAADLMTGTIQQVPSAYSAIRVGGVHSYALARNGCAVELPARTIEIYWIHILSVCPPFLRIRVGCSQGTYIRALGRDLGKAAGCSLTLSFLLREKTGCFDLKNALTLEEVEACPEKAAADTASVLDGLPRVCLDKDREDDFLHGRPIPCQQDSCGASAVYCGEIFLGIAQCDGAILRPKKVFL